MARKSLDDIWALIDPEGTRAALERQREPIVTRLADIKAAYIVEQANTFLEAEQKATLLKEYARQAGQLAEALENIDARLKASEEALTPSRNGRK